jgi:hypothetical protein
MVGIGVLYGGIVFSIWRTREATTISLPDSDLALRLFFIVLANACAWLPIIALKIMAFFRASVSGITCPRAAFTVKVTYGVSRKVIK